MKVSTSKKRIILFNQVSGPLFYDLSRELSTNSYEVVLHTGDESLYKGRSENFKLSIAPKYNRKSKTTKFISWFLYLLSSINLIFFHRKNDFFIFSTNPPLIFFLIYLKKIFSKIDYLIVSYDLYPEILKSNGLIRNNGIVDRIWTFVNEKVYDGSKVIITLNSSMRNELLKFSTKDKIRLIPPWADCSYIYPIKKVHNKFLIKNKLSNKFVILYSGNIGADHEIDTIVNAAETLLNEKHIIFIFAGSGEKIKFIKKQKKEKKLNNILLFPYQSKKNFPFLLSAASIALVGLSKRNSNLMMPSKTISYMAAGTPIISISPESSSLSGIIKTHNCGENIPNSDHNLLAKRIISLNSDEELLKNYSKNSRLTAINFYNKDLMIELFIKLISESAND